MPPEPGWLGRLIDERAGRRRAARTRLSMHLRAFGYRLNTLDTYGFESKYAKRVAQDIRQRIKGSVADRKKDVKKE